MDWTWAKQLPSKVTPGNVLRYGGAASLAAGVPMMAYSAARSQRGEMLEDAAIAGAGVATYPVMATLAAGAVGLIPGIGPVSRLAAPLIGTVLAYAAGERSTRPVTGVFRLLNQSEKQLARLEFGAGWRDTESTRAQRQRAAAEMSGSLVQARRVFGREAELMHR